MPSGPIISFERVNKFFGHHQVLNDISFQIDEGEVIVVFGPSGGGKSTMIRCINRLEPINSGHIVVDTSPCMTPRPISTVCAPRWGMVFQHFNLFPHLTALDNVTLAPVNVRKHRAQRPKPRR